MTVEGAPDRERLGAFDGLRGVACLVVVCGHLWLVVPVSTLDQTGPLRGLFQSGSLGVTVFMVMGAFLVTRGLDRELAGPNGVDVGRFWIRRLLRIGSQLFPFLAIVLIVSWFDRWDSYSPGTTNQSVMAAATFRLNWLLVDDPAGVRQDFGHLWYLSVEQQFYVVWLIALAWLGRFRRTLVTALALVVVGVWIGRANVLERDGWWRASLLTITRVDALALGAIIGLVMPRLGNPTPAVRRTIQAGGAVAVVGAAVLIGWSAHLDGNAYLGTQGAAFAVLTTVAVGAVALAGNARNHLVAALAWTPLRVLGRVSLPLYLWHLPAFWAANRWARWVDWRPRFCVVAAGLVVICFAADRWIEGPVARWLAGRAAGRRGAATGEISSSGPVLSSGGAGG